MTRIENIPISPKRYFTMIFGHTPRGSGSATAVWVKIGGLMTEDFDRIRDIGNDCIKEINMEAKRATLQEFRFASLTTTIGGYFAIRMYFPWWSWEDRCSARLLEGIYEKWSLIFLNRVLQYYNENILPRVVANELAD